MLYSHMSLAAHARHRIPLRFAVTALVAVMLTTLSAALPQPTGLVTDAANVLDESVERQIQATLRDVEQKSGAQVAVATVSSLDSMTIDDYAERLFRVWGIGQKGKDNGVLILVAPTDRAVRIEVGYGLEGVLPDGLAGQIIREQAIPAFRNGDFPGGIRATADRVAAIVVANHLLTDQERAALDDGTAGRPSAFASTAFFSMFVVIGALSAGAGLRTRAVVPLLWGGVFGGIPFGLAFVPFFNTALWFLVPLALGMFAVGYVRGADESVQKAMRGPASKRKGSSSSGPGWVKGSTRSSSRGGSRSGGSSFGGGRSGGGGASGRW
jgi:uncharacterized protein